MTQPAPKPISASGTNDVRDADSPIERRSLFDRRRFLRLAATGAAGGAAWIAAGCFGDDDDPPATATAEPTGSATPAPQRGGTLRMGQATDPMLTGGYPFALVSANRILAYAAHETLIQYQDSLTPTPLLADRFEVTSDFRRVIVRLKEGLEFHNGAPVTSDDVAFSVETVRDPASAGLPATVTFDLGAFARTITDIKVVDPRNIEFTLDQPRTNIADLFAQLHIAHRESFAGIARGEVIGTGPFRFDTWEEGGQFTLTRFDNWHGASAGGPPYLDAIEVSVNPDVTASMLSFRAGNLDAYLAVSAPVAAQVRDMTRTAGKTGMHYLGLNVTHPVLQDARVRQAIFFALNRDRVLTDAGHSFGKVTTQPWAQSSPAHEPARDAAFSDIARAESLLAEAGYSTDREVVIEYPASSPLHELQAQLIQSDLQTIKMNVSIRGVEPTQYQLRYRSREFTDCWLASHLGGDMTPLTMLQQTFEFRPTGNLSHFEDAQYASLVARLEELDPQSPEAIDVYGELNQLMLENPFLIPTGIPQARIDLVADQVGGWPARPEDYAIAVSGKVDLGNVWLR